MGYIKKIVAMKKYVELFESFQDKNGQEGIPAEQEDVMKKVHDLMMYSDRSKKNRDEILRLLHHVEDVDAILFKNGVLETTLLNVAALKGLGDVMIALLDRGADPNSRTAGGFTPLHSLMFATVPDPAGMIHLLLKRGADINAQDDDGNTPLHWGASKARNAEVLLKAGADTRIKNSEGESAVQKTMGNNLLIKDFIIHGANPGDVFDDPEGLLQYSGGDDSWIPKHAQDWMERRVRSRGAFGRF